MWAPTERDLDWGPEASRWRPWRPARAKRRHRKRQSSWRSCGALRSWACFGVGNMVDFPGKTMGKYYGTKTTIWEKNYMGKAYRTMMISIRYEKNKGNIVIFSGIEMDLSI